MKKPLIFGCLVYTFIVASCSKVETKDEKTSGAESVQKTDTTNAKSGADFVIEVTEDGELHVKNVVN